MSAAFMNLYVDGECIRTCGGNKREIRTLTNWYNSATFEELLKKHPWLKKDDMVVAKMNNKS